MEDVLNNYSEEEFKSKYGFSKESYRLMNEPLKQDEYQLKQSPAKIIEQDLLEIKEEKSNLNEINWSKRKELLLPKVVI